MSRINTEWDLLYDSPYVDFDSSIKELEIQIEELRVLVAESKFEWPSNHLFEIKISKLELELLETQIEIQGLLVSNPTALSIGHAYWSNIHNHKLKVSLLKNEIEKALI